MLLAVVATILHYFVAKKHIFMGSLAANRLQAARMPAA